MHHLAAALAVKLTVFAAASLTVVLPSYQPLDTYSFAGSNALATQITLGAPADVFLSANTSIPQQLHAKGLVGKPIVFTRNSLILIVPKSNPAHIHGIFDLRNPGVKLDVAAVGVPVGDYTRTVLANLGLTDVLQHAISQESDVREVLAKVALGEADAGFVYTTDARSVRGQVKTIGIRPSAQPTVDYAGAVVSSSKHKQAALAYLRSLLSPEGQATLRSFGFQPLSKKP